MRSLERHIGDASTVPHPHPQVSLMTRLLFGRAGQDRTCPPRRRASLNRLPTHSTSRILEGMAMSKPERSGGPCPASLLLPTPPGTQIQKGSRASAGLLCRCARKGFRQRSKAAQAADPSSVRFDAVSSSVRFDVVSVPRTFSWVSQFYVRP